MRAKIASSAPAGDEDVVGPGGLVERGDLAPEERVAGRFRVAEAEVAPQRGGLVVGEGEQVAHRPRLDVARAEEVADGELPAGEVAFELEVGDPHQRMMPRLRRPRRWSRILRAMNGPIVITGSPTSLGGHFDGMERTPDELRALGIEDRLRATTGPGPRDARGRRERTQRPGLGAGRGPSSEEPGPDLRLPPPARDPRSATPWRATGRTRGCCCSEATARPTPARWPVSAGRGPGLGWRSPGSMPTGTSTRRPPRRPATSGACRWR